jgi:hypothetical protein
MPTDAPWPGYEPSPHFRMMTAFGLAGVLVLVAGSLLFAHFEPVVPPSGLHASIAIKRYDPATGHVSGEPQNRFTSSQIPAAVVDWRSLPRDVVVESGWFDTTGYQLEGTRPARADGQPAQVPLSTARDVQIPPGSYTFAVGRYQDGRMVEVLGRVAIQVGSA